MLRIAICDDDNFVCSQLEEILLNLGEAYLEKLDIDIFYSGMELDKSIQNGESYDLIFLDIEMEHMNGVEFGTKLRNEYENEITLIIYISSMENYAMQLFQARPMDFIIKPLNYEKISKVFETALRLILKDNEVFQYQTGHTVCKAPLKDILYFESVNRKINIITTRRKDIFYGILNDIYKNLQAYNFIYIHKSFLVNYNHIVKFEYRQVTMSDNRILPISQQNRKAVRSLQLRIERNK
ncbi:LytTR family two component transcriptional regulator [Mobilisporobacter senegalensis]|uniref:Stage 0 sporulation protein A homolog n=1 Tax=Mobilisporobacter senegalensis TaxID=1329262 RepID=A0A3N1XJM3_9FIRM|nr:LytTR family DNA-binding domain-containing protein [Mobilisporobacter senegalensis]ROR25252.1 LytTR family two component transcriptional regulator [Mobilisporobacter senegalensis]